MKESVVEPWTTNQAIVNVGESVNASGTRRDLMTERHVNECVNENGSGSRPTTDSAIGIAHTERQNGNHEWIVHGTGTEIGPPHVRLSAVGRSMHVLASPTVKCANTTSSHTKPWMPSRWPTATTTASASNVGGAAVPSSRPDRHTSTRDDSCVNETLLV